MQQRTITEQKETDVNAVGCVECRHTVRMVWVD